MFDHTHYVPVLKGKAGEYGALKALDGTVKPRMTPLIEVPLIPWDHVNDAPDKTIGDHLAKVADNILAAWEQDRPLFLDLRFIDNSERMADGGHPLTFVFGDARAKGLGLIPVTGLQRDPQYQAEVVRAAQIDGHGLCVRVESEDMGDSVEEDLDRLLDSLAIPPSRIDIIIDLERIPSDQIRIYSAMMRNFINGLPHLDLWRTITVVASSFPETLSEIERNSEGRFPRAEWLIYQEVASSRKTRRIPTYGDYTIVPPALVDFNPRIMQLGAKVKYTSEEEWIIVKGQSIRRAGATQTHALCQHIIGLPEYSGSTFCWGDSVIDNCAKMMTGPGNQTTWVKVGVNHHLAFAVNQLANFHAP